MEERQFSTTLIYTLIVLVFSALIGRLFYLQVIARTELGEISSQNSIRKIPIDAPRGIMYDRNGVIVVDNQPLYTLQITPAEFDKKTIPLLSSLLNLSQAELIAQIEDAESYSKFVPSKISRDIDFAKLSRVEENLWRLPGVNFVIDNKREYLPQVHGSHLFGYTKSVSKLMLEKLPKDLYSRNDLIGQSGLERYYENVLRGEKGTRFIMVNSSGKHLGDFENGKSNIPAERGSDLYLTIDAELQAAAESLLTATGKSGAVVALNPQNGEVLAFTSQPDFNLNALEGVTDAATWNMLVNSETKPMFNRVTQTRYPPGSTLKMVTAIAALEEGIAKPSQTFFCSGRFRFGNKEFLCHRGHGHGTVDMERSIEVSCNNYYYNLVLRIGFDRWNKYCRMFGFGEKTGLDLFEDQTAPLPSPELFDKMYGKNGWTNGFTVSLGIGQGEVGASPIQLARYTAALGTGELSSPHLLRGYRDRKNGTTIDLSSSFQNKKLPISAESWSVIRAGLLGCVEGTGGTAHAAKVDGIKVAGKTGTAQNPHGEDHAWFIGYAPFEKPTIAIVVMVENAGFGGTVSAPIAGNILKRYFKKYPVAIDSTKSQTIAQADIH